MDWKQVAKVAGKGFLMFFEYFFKISAVLAGGLALGAGGSFGTKLGTGFSSLSPALRKLWQTPRNISETASIINDYNTMTAAAFNQQYGGEAVKGVLEYLNEGIVYIQAVNQNLYYQPLATVTAALIAFLAFYLLGRVLRFARQKGRGSFFTRLELKIGERVFRQRSYRRKPDVQQQPVSQSTRNDEPVTYSKPKKSNNYLQKYIKSHQRQ